MSRFGKNSTAYICYIIVNVFWYLALIGGGAMIIGVISMIFGWIHYPPELLTFSIPISTSEVVFSSESISDLITIEHATVDIKSQYIFNQNPNLLVGLQIFGAFSFCLFLFGFYQLRMLLQTSVYHAVFTAKNIRRLKNMAYIVMAIDPLWWIYYQLFAKNFGSFVQQKDLTITLGSFDMGYIVYGLLLYTLAAIFEKGYEMYKELKLTV